MAIIQTQRNIVYAYEPQPGDVLLSVGWSAPFGDGKHRRPVSLRYLPIGEYAETVEWAKELADQLAYPIHVLPLNHNDIFNTARWHSFREYIAGMGGRERGELRRIIVTTCCEVMRDSDDADIRADMFEVLRQLKVTYES